MKTKKISVVRDVLEIMGQRHRIVVRVGLFVFALSKLLTKSLMFEQSENNAGQKKSNAISVVTSIAHVDVWR